LAKSATDLILLSRQKSNTERSKFVSDTEVLGYCNEGRTELRDLVIAADPSYYHQQIDLVFNSPAGYPAGSAALPTNVYKLRGVTQNPDTHQRRAIHPLAFADRDGRRYRKSGYTLDGDYLTIVPASMANQGPIRLYFTPKLLPLAQTIVVAHTSGDNVVSSTGVWTFAAGAFDQTYVGATLTTSGTSNAGNSGSFVITAVPSATTLQTATTGLVNETFGPSVTASVQPVNTVFTLDVTLDNFDSYISTFAAVKIATKMQKTDLVQLLQGQLGQDRARVSQMAAVRAGEPEAIPVLWNPSNYPVTGWGWDY
jgi:hypothetical protein